MALKSYATPIEKIWHYVFLVICACVLLFLILPELTIIPLSFNAQPFFTYTEGMLSLDPEAYSLKWYKEFFASDPWTSSFRNSFVIGFFAALLSTFLGTLAALGLSNPRMPYKAPVLAILMSPIVIPIIISGSAIFFFFSNIGLSGKLSLVLAHTIIGTPFVVITVSATLKGFDRNYIRASQSLGAGPVTTFFKVITPLILPGVISGWLFAFVASFDEVVIVLFLAEPADRTVPILMWSGLREQLSPVILAVATITVVVSVILLIILEIFRRRSEKNRGITPS